MDGPDADELRRLRARAYGPDADIAGDPAAQTRLAELEARSHAAPAWSAKVSAEASRADEPPSAAADAESAASEPPTVAATDAGTDAPAADDARAPDPAGTDVPAPLLPPAPGRAPAHRRRRLIVGWAASLALVGVVVGVATTAITTAATRPAGQPEGITRIATLHTDTAFVPPMSYESSSAKVSGFDEFHGLTAMAIRGWLGVANAPCLLIVQTDELSPDADTLDGDMHYGCSAGEFPATVTLRVDSRLPAGIREMFADGTGLQFVLTGEDVQVSADHAPTAAPTTTSHPVPRVSPTPLAIPQKADGELTRAVVHPDDDGYPTVTTIVSDAPAAGVDYAMDAACTSRRRGVEMTFELRTTGSQPQVLEGGTVACNGPPFRMTGELVGDTPPQVVFTDTDGVRDAYVVVAPSQ